MDFKFAPADPATRFCSLVGRLEETVEWTSPKANGPAWRRRPRDIDFTRVIPELLDANIEDRSTEGLVNYRINCRLPDDYHLTSSTVPETKTPLRVTHRLTFVATVQDTERDVKKAISISRPVTIACVSKSFHIWNGEC